MLKKMKQWLGCAAGTCVAVALSLCAVTATADWTYNSAANTITDGMWTLNVTASGTDLTITSVNVMPPAVSPIDFTMPISDGTTSYALVAIADAASSSAGAFYSARNIISGTIQFPATLTKVGAYAFYECKKLTGSLAFPDGVTTIGTGAFCHCEGFAGTLTLSPNLTSVGQDAFRYSYNFTGHVVVPSGVTVIPLGAFDSLNKISSVEIHGAVTSMGQYAFASCYAMTSITYYAGCPASVHNDVYKSSSKTVTHVKPEYADSWEAGLASGSLYRNTGMWRGFPIVCDTTLLGISFDSTGATGGQTGGIFIEAGAAMPVITANPPVLGSLQFLGYFDARIGGKKYYNADMTTAVASWDKAVSGVLYAQWEFPDWLYNAGAGTLGNSVWTLNVSASGTQLTITGVAAMPASLMPLDLSKRIADSSGTDSYTITAIADGSGSSSSVFYTARERMNAILLPNTLTKVGAYAFYECKKLTGALAFPDSVTEIGRSAFYRCEGFDGTLTISPNLTSIGQDAFRYSNNFIGHVVVPAGVTTIPLGAFDSLYKITSAEIFGNVTSMGQYAFASCYVMTSLTFYAGCPASVHNDIYASTANVVTHVKPEYAANWDVNLASGSLYAGTGTWRGKPIVCDTLVPGLGFDASGGTGGQVEGTFLETGAAMPTLTVNPPVLGTLQFLGYFDAMQGGKKYYNADMTTAVSTWDKTKSTMLYAQWSFPGWVYDDAAGTISNSIWTLNVNAAGTDLTITSVASMPGEAYPMNLSTPVLGTDGQTVYAIVAIADGTANSSSVFYSARERICSVRFPDTIAKIGGYAFAECKKIIGELVLPDSVTSVGRRAFYSCENFNGALVLSQSLTSIGEDAFRGGYNFIGEVVVPAGVTELTPGVFDSLYKISSVEVLGNVHSINTYTFASCYALTSVYFRVGCPALNSLNVYTASSKVTTYIPEASASFWELTLDSGSIFNRNGVWQGRPIVCVPTTTHIGVAFDPNGGTGGEWRGFFVEQGGALPTLISIIPVWDEFEFLGYFDALSGGKKYYNADMSAAVSVWDKTAYTKLYAQWKTRDWVYDSSVGTLYNGVWTLTVTCSGTELAVTGVAGMPGSPYPLNLRGQISDAASGQIAYTLVEIADGADAESGAFYTARSSISSLQLPGTVRKIGAYAFNGCASLGGALEMPVNVAVIGNYAFKSCGIESVAPLSDNVSIGNGAFGECPKLKSVTFAGGYPSPVGADIYDSSRNVITYVGGRYVDVWETNLDSGSFYARDGVWQGRQIICLATLVTFNANGGTGGETGAFFVEYGAAMPAIATTPPTLAGGDASFDGYCDNNGNRYYNSNMTASRQTWDKTTDTTLYAQWWGSPSDWEYRESDGTLSRGDWVLSAELRDYWEYDYWRAYDGKVVVITGVISAPHTPQVLDLNGYVYPVEGFDYGYYWYDLAIVAIEYGVFYSQENLSGIRFPESLTRIESWAFENCENLTTLILPESFHENVRIGEYAFSNCSGLSGTLAIHRSVSEIGYGAFENCTGLTGLEFADDGNLRSINERAFAGCSGLSGSLTISGNVSEIGRSAFENCSGLTGLKFAGSYISIGNYAFNNCTSLSGAVTLPATVGSIGLEAFGNCENLTSVFFNGGYPSSSVGADIYLGADHVVTYVTWPQAAGWEANLEAGSLYTHDGVWKGRPIQVYSGSVITFDANGGTGGETGSFFSDIGVKMPSIIKIAPPVLEGHLFLGYFSEDGAKYYNSDMTAAVNVWNQFGGATLYAQWRFDGWIYDAAAGTLSDGIWSLNATASGTELTITGVAAMPSTKTPLDLSGRVSNTELTASYTVVAIADGASSSTGAFYPARNIISGIQFPDTLRTIGAHAFRSCNSLTGDLVIPDSVTSIGDYAFSSCSGLNGTLMLSASLTHIGESAFNYCSGFTGNLMFPDGLVYIGTSAFVGCSKFTGDLIFPDSVMTINTNAFRLCSGFDGILKLPANLTSIPQDAFIFCRGLTGDIVIPDGVTFIGEGAFYSCGNFNGTLTLSSSLTYIDVCAFISCSGLIGDLIIPQGVTFIGNMSLRNLAVSNMLIQTDAVTIEEFAFSFCGNLESVAFAGDYPVAVSNYIYHVSPVTTYIRTDYINAWEQNLDSGSFSTDNAIWYGRPIVCGGDDILLFDANGGTGGETRWYFVNRGEALPVLTTTAPVRENFIFQGYFDAPSGGTKYYNADMTSAATWDKSDNATLYAQWRYAGWVYDAGAGTLSNGTWSLNVTASGTELTITGVASYPSTAQPLDMRGLILNPAGTEEYSVVAIKDGTSGTSGVFYPARTRMSSLRLPETLRTIGAHAFRDCTGLRGDLIIPDSVTAVYFEAFRGCTQLNGTLTLSTNLVYIGDSAFEALNRITGDIVIPDSVTTIEGQAFFECYGTTGTLTLSTNLTFIGYEAFKHCQKMTGDIVVPAGVTNVAFAAFSDMYQINSIEFLGDLIEINTRAFAVCTNLTSVTFAGGYPASVPATDIYQGSPAATSYVHAAYANSWDANLDDGSLFTRDGVWQGQPIVCLGDDVITFDPNNGTDGEAFRMFAIRGGEMPVVTTNAPVLTGHVFLGYFDASSGGTQYYDAGMNAVAETWEHEEDITLHAQWEAGSYTVTLDMNGGSMDGNTEDRTAIATYGSAMPTSGFSVPVKDGKCFFAGFFDAVTGGTKYYNADMTSATAWDKGGDSTLYAQWQQYDWLYDATANTMTDGTWVFKVTRSGTNLTISGTASVPSELTPLDLRGTIMGTAGTTQYSLVAIAYGPQWMGVLVAARNVMSSVRFPDTVTSIGQAAFYQFTNLSGPLILPAGLKSTDMYSFGECTGLTGELIIPDGMTTIGSATFHECSGFTGDLVIPDSVTSMGAGAFRECTGFKGTLTLPANLKQIPEQAFYLSSGFTGTLVIPEGVTSIGRDAFGRCAGFTGTLVIPESVTAISKSAFAECLKIETVIFRSSNVTIGVEGWGTGNSVFGYNSSLRNVTFTGTYPANVGDGGVYLGTHGVITYVYREFALDWENESSVTGSLYDNSGVWQTRPIRILDDPDVRFDANGGTGGETREFFIAPDGSTPTITTTAPTREGHTFTGYFDASEGGVPYYSEEMSIIVEMWDKAESTTLYAQWAANTYTVTFDGNGGSTPSPQSIDHTFGSVYQLPSDPSRTGYTFNGWFTAASGGDEVTTATIVTNTAAHTIYAQWKANIASDMYVAKFGSDTNDGTSWATAKLTIQGAIDSIASGYSITVSNGVYDAINAAGKDLTIQSREEDGRDVTIITGNGATTVAILSELEGYWYNSFTLSSTTLLKGFTLKDGYAASNTGLAISGVIGGTLVDCVVTNCMTEGPYENGVIVATHLYDSYIVGNAAANAIAMGALEEDGMCIASNTVFTGNVAVIRGSVVENYILQECGVTGNETGVLLAECEARDSVITDNTAQTGFINMSAVERCVVTGNELQSPDGAGFGAGVSTIRDSVFSGNSVTGDELAALALFCIFERCEIVGNIGPFAFDSLITDSLVAGNTGGFDCSTGSISELLFGSDYTCAVNVMLLGAAYNTTFADNTFGDGFEDLDIYSFIGAELYNCIVWNNEGDNVFDPDDYPETPNLLLPACTVENSIIPGAAEYGATNIDADPMFLGNGSYRLKVGSPAIDAGDNTHVIGSVSYTSSGFPVEPFDASNLLDLDGNGRIYGDGTVDMGAYEFGHAKNTAVTFDGNGGSTPAQPVQTVGAYYDLPAAPTYTGYSFNGWFTAAAGGNEVTGSMYVTNTAAHTVYAQWEGAEYTVTLDMSGGSMGGSAADKTVTATYGATMPAGGLSVPVKEGNSIFLGFFDAASGGNQYYNADMSSAAAWDKTEDATLYAQWMHADWIYNPADNTMTDGTWVLEVTASDTELTIVDLLSMPSEPTALDLRGTIIGIGTGSEYALVAIGDGELIWLEVHETWGVANWFGVFSSASNTMGSVQFPDTLETIGTYAFRFCKSLAGDLVIPDSVTSLGKSAFGECYGLDGTLTLSQNITNIDEATFQQCMNITGPLVLPPNLESIGAYAFNGCHALGGDLVIPNSVTNIGSAAFWGTGFETVVSPSTGITLATDVFAGSYTLASVNFTGAYPESAVNNLYSYSDYVITYVEGGHVDSWEPELDEGSLYNNTGVWKGRPIRIRIDAKPGWIYDAVSSTMYNHVWSLHVDCTGSELSISGVNWQPSEMSELDLRGPITSVDGSTSYTLVEIGGEAFNSHFENYADNMESVRFPETLRNISWGAFNGCASISGELVIPGSVTNLGDYAFANCYGIYNLVLTDGLVSIGGWAFSDTNIDGILVLPSTVATIGEGAFFNCWNLTGTLVFPDSLKKIGGAAFMYCENITGTLAIPAGVESIGESAFSGCYGFSGLAFGEDSVLQTIQASAFAGCTFFGEVVVPDSVTYIGDSAFDGCYYVRSIVCPSDGVTIGSRAFADNWSLRSVMFTGEYPASVGSDLYTEWTDTTTYVLRDYVDSWQDKVDYGVILNGDAYWMGRPIRVAGSVISFDANRGTGGETRSTFVETGDVMPDISATPAPERRSFVFIGYFDARRGGKQYYNDDMSAAVQAWDKNGDTTLYAQWRAALPGGIDVDEENNMIIIPGLDGEVDDIGTPGSDDIVVHYPENIDPSELYDDFGNVTVPEGGGVTNSEGGGLGVDIPEGSVITGDSVIVTPGETDVPEVDANGVVTIPEGGHVYIYIPPVKEITLPDGYTGEINPETPDRIDLFDENGDPDGYITIPDGIWVRPDPEGDDPNTGEIRVPGQNGVIGDEDDVIITDGTYDPETGYVTVNEDGRLEDENGDPIQDPDGNDIGGPGTLVDDNGVIIVPPEDGELTVNPDGTVDVPPGGEVWVFIPPAELVGEGPGTYDPNIPAFIDEDGKLTLIPDMVEIIIDPSNPDEDPFTGRITVPGLDGIFGTDDDIMITDGTYDPETGYVKVNEYGELCNTNWDPVRDAEDNAVGGPDTLVDVGTGVILVPPAGETLTVDPEDRSVVIPEGGEVWVYVPPAVLVGQGPGVFAPDVPAFVEDDGTTVIFPDLIVIEPTDYDEDPYTGTITVPGRDGIPGTDDDIVIIDGTYDPETGYVEVNENGSLENRDGDPIEDADGNDIGGPGTIVDDNGIIIVPPENGEITIDPETGVVTVPEGGEIWTYIPPAVLISEGPATYDPNEPATIEDDGKIIIYPELIIIEPFNPGEDPYTGRITVPGQDGIPGTEDDVVITDGTYDPDSGYVWVNEDGVLENKDGGRVQDKGGNNVGGPGSLVDGNGVILVPGEWSDLYIRDDGTVYVPDDGEVWVYVPPAKRIGDGGGTYDPDLPALIKDDGTIISIPDCTVTTPEGIVIEPFDSDEDLYTGKITVPGFDYAIGTEDDVVITDGTYKYGYAEVNEDGILENKDGDPINIGGPGTLVDSRGVIMVPPENESFELDYGLGVFLPEGTEVWVYLPDAKHIVTIPEGETGTYYSDYIPEEAFWDYWGPAVYLPGESDTMYDDLLILIPSGVAIGVDGSLTVPGPDDTRGTKDDVTITPGDYERPYVDHNGYVKVLKGMEVLDGGKNTLVTDKGREIPEESLIGVNGPIVIYVEDNPYWVKSDYEGDTHDSPWEVAIPSGGVIAEWDEEYDDGAGCWVERVLENGGTIAGGVVTENPAVVPAFRGHRITAITGCAEATPTIHWNSVEELLPEGESFAGHVIYATHDLGGACGWTKISGCDDAHIKDHPVCNAGDDVKSATFTGDHTCSCGKPFRFFKKQVKVLTEN